MDPKVIELDRSDYRVHQPGEVPERLATYLPVPEAEDNFVGRCVLALAFVLLVSVGSQMSRHAPAEIGSVVWSQQNR